MRSRRLVLALGFAATVAVIAIVPFAGAAGPSVVIGSGPSNPTADPTPSFSFDSPDDPLAIFECQLDGGGFSVCASPKAYPAVGDGSHTFQVQATNILLETGAPASYSWTVDTTPPPAPTVAGPTGTIVDTTPSFTFSSAGAASFLCGFDDTTPAAACTSPHAAANALADGAHTFSVIARDALNNASPVSTVAFTIDTTPPPAPSVAGPTGTIVDTTPSFTFSSAGATSFLCAFDDTTPAAACTSPHAAANALADGAHTFSVIARDALNNASPVSTVAFTIDTTPPPAPTLGGASGTIADKTPTFTFTAAGATSYFCAIDDTTPTTACASPFTPSALADGAHTFSALARDGAGNSSAVATRAFTIDSTGPTLTGPGNLTVAANSGSGSQVTFNVTASDNGVALLPSAVKCTPPSGSMFKIQTTGVSCTASDALGNVGALSFSVRVVDLAPPSINAPDVSVTATSSAGIRRTDPALAAYLAGISATDLISSVKLTTNVPDTLPIGVNSIVVTAVDASGNTARKTVRITVLPVGKAAPKADLTPPLPVRKAVAKPGDHTIVLTWVPPAAVDLAYVQVKRSIAGAPGRETLVYKGLKRTLKNRGLRNNVTYRFVLVAYDKAGNSSRSIVVTAKPAARLLAFPRANAKVLTPPMLRWAPVRSASYFNVQLYRDGVKVLSAWPQVARLQLGKRWVYDHKRFTLKPGKYTWYVWPGIGKRSDTKYGPLLGSSSFVVAASAKSKNL